MLSQKILSFNKFAQTVLFFLIYSLSTMHLTLLEDVLSFASLPLGSVPPLWLLGLDTPFVSITRTGDGFSIIFPSCFTERLKEDTSDYVIDSDWSAFKVTYPKIKGRMSSLSLLLEDIDLPSKTYQAIGNTESTDYFLTKISDVELAIAKVVSAGHSVSRVATKSNDLNFSVSPSSCKKNNIVSTFKEPTLGTDILDYCRLIGLLKLQKRSGWLRCGIKFGDCESVADHMYRMALLAFALNEKDEKGESVNIEKCVLIALVHDIAEAVVGDITPFDGISKEEKHRREKITIEKIEKMCVVHLNFKFGGRIAKLWWEYELKASAEGLLVKDIDKFEMCLQANEYEELHGIKLENFFESVRGKIVNDKIKSWFDTLENKRHQRNQRK
eukprot:GSMAST32.ASY1.ANO1.1284.1 assembled CDS